MNRPWLLTEKRRRAWPLIESAYRDRTAQKQQLIAAETQLRAAEKQVQLAEENLNQALTGSGTGRKGVVGLNIFMLKR